MFWVNLSYCIYVDSVPSASNFTPSFTTTLISSLVFLFKQVSFYHYIHCASSGQVQSSLSGFTSKTSPIYYILVFQSSTSASLDHQATYLSPWLPSTESPAVCFIYNPQFGQRAACLGDIFQKTLVQCWPTCFKLCETLVNSEHTLLIPHLLHGTLPLSLLIRV